MHYHIVEVADYSDRIVGRLPYRFVSEHEAVHAIEDGMPAPLGAYLDVEPCAPSRRAPKARCS